MQKQNFLIRLSARIVGFALAVAFLSSGVRAAAAAGPARSFNVLPFRDQGVVTGDGTSKFRTYFSPQHELPTGSEKTKLFVGSMINADYYLLRNVETLSHDKEDARNQFRQRTELSFLLKYGTDNEQERAAVETRVTIANTLFMRQIYRASFYHDEAIVRGSPFDDEFSPIKTQFQEAWFKVNCDQLLPQMEKHPHFFKIGYFPYLVGRGISLGDWMHGGVDYMGFKKNGLQTYAPMFPPGMLWRGEIGKHASYDVYFSPAVSEAVSGADYGQKALVGDRFVQPKTIKLPIDSLSSRHIFAVSAKVGCEFSEMSDSIAVRDGQAQANPYWVYYNSPRQTIDRGADAPIDFHTFGLMADMRAGGLEINFELAKQVGRQTVREAVYNNFPSVNHFDPVTGAFRALPASEFAKLPAGSINPANRTTWLALEQEAKLAEHHPSYDVNLSGWMAVFDARYSFEDYPVIAAIAGGYFSGDAFPYNDNVDNYFASSGNTYHDVATDGTVSIKPQEARKYKGFLPLRDWEYAGLWAHPLVMVNAGIVPRPKQLDLFSLSAPNDSDTLTNLVYLGGGLTVRPMEDRKKMRLNANVFGYWNDERLKKWDKTETPPARLVGNEGGQEAYDQFQIPGWLSSDTASKFLGWEINAVVNYKFTDNLDLSTRAGIFFPGGTYSDIMGQPNNQTIQSGTTLSSTAGRVENVLNFKGLGDNKAYGFYARIRYVF